MASATPSWTSTNETPSLIWIAPTTLPGTSASFVMAPTRSPGRRPALRPPPTKRRTHGPSDPARPAFPTGGPPGRETGVPRMVRPGAGRPVRTGGPAERGGEENSTSSTFCPPAPSIRLMAARAMSTRSNSSVNGSTTPRKRSYPSPRSASRRFARRISVRRSRRSATVGRWAILSFTCVAASMLRSIRCSRGSTSVIATPSRPARPVRPIRWT